MVLSVYALYICPLRVSTRQNAMELWYGALDASKDMRDKIEKNVKIISHRTVSNYYEIMTSSFWYRYCRFLYQLVLCNLLNLKKPLRYLCVESLQMAS